MLEKTINLIEATGRILEDYHPMTLRQIFYQLVSKQILENDTANYERLGRALVPARKEGRIPWEWIEDRLRKPRPVSQWEGLPDFAETACEAYRRSVWVDQEIYIEAWLEKDALSGVFERVLEDYGVTLNVGRGYDGWSSIFEAAGRFGPGDNVEVLYFGDFDPSGEDMLRSLKERLAFFGCEPEIKKVAITQTDIRRYGLPPNPVKKTDSRSKRFIAEYGVGCVELDALPPDILEDRIRREVEARLNMTAFKKTLAAETKERARLKALLKDPE
jgi:hypothetical protein